LQSAWRFANRPSSRAHFVGKSGESEEKVSRSAADIFKSRGKKPQIRMEKRQIARRSIPSAATIFKSAGKIGNFAWKSGESHGKYAPTADILRIARGKTVDRKGGGWRHGVMGYGIMGERPPGFRVSGRRRMGWISLDKF
jgi:hypothetical protein